MRGLRLRLRLGRVGLLAGIAASAGGGCTSACEDDGLLQDNAGECQAQSSDGTSDGPPISADPTTSTGEQDSSSGSSSSSSSSSSTGDDRCGNGRLDPGEVGIDCGGVCDAACDDPGLCDAPEDCPSGVCTGGVCQPEACADGVLNGDELNIDCGGSCPPCGAGLSCQSPDDCASGICDDNTCVAATCSDGVRNGHESDVDCGGDCPGCDDGQTCSSPLDCSSAVCLDGLCSGPSCADGVRNGDETDVDCGGACPLCDLGSTCEGNTDCASESCADGTCAPLPVSCLAILSEQPDAADGEYRIDPDGIGGVDPLTTRCDMTTDGGGWTEITPCMAVVLGGTLIAVEPAADAGIEAETCRPFAMDLGMGAHTYTFTFTFAPTWTEFYLADYEAEALTPGLDDTSDIGPSSFVQSTWNQAGANLHGDVSFGSGDAVGPATSFAAEGSDVELQVGQRAAWPADRTPYTVPPATAFRIGWGESGPQSEGWFPWASGTIYLR